MSALRLPAWSLLLLCTHAIAGTGAPQTSSREPAPPAASAQVSPLRCPVVTDSPTPADRLLARKSYKDAESAYRDAFAKDPASEDAQLGLVRSFIGEDEISAARAEALKMLAAHPASAVAEVANAEADYRAADVPGALLHARAAMQKGGCEGRAAGIVAAIYDLSGYYATSARMVARAHSLRPADELLRRDWIDSLPRRQRQGELARYLEGDHNLSADDEREYGNELEHLRARKPGECRVVSHAEHTATPMRPVYGDSLRPEAFGLDVLFNGKRHRMQIDTGASGIVLTQSAARDLKLEPEYRLKTGGVGDEGELDSFLTHVHSIRIGEVEVSDCMVEVVQKSKLSVDGLIGMDVFRQWLVTLDYQDAQVRLSPLPSRPGAPTAARLESDPLPADVGDEDETPHDPFLAPDMADWLQVLRIGHQVLLHARIKDGPFHYLVMDTGAEASNLSLAMAREGGKLHADDSVRVIGMSGEVNKVYTVEHVPLQVENLGLTESDYFAYDMTTLSHHSGFELSGLLGLPTLQRLTISIDYRDNLLKLTYDPRHDRQRF